MDVFAKVGERIIDKAMTFEQAAVSKALGDDQDGVMPPITGTRVSDMLPGVIRDHDLIGRQGLLETFSDPVLKAHGSTWRNGRTVTSS